MHRKLLLMSPLLFVYSSLAHVSHSAAQNLTSTENILVRQNLDSCYMTTDSGLQINLEQMCGSSQSLENNKSSARDNVTTKVLPNGNVETTVEGSAPHLFPDGSSVQIKDSKVQLAWPNGLRAELVPGAKGSGFQYYSDGKKLSPGQSYTLPNGQKGKQERL